MIPYNPSSFDTNKTLLENILELKKWLQAHPCYEVFYSSANGDTSQQQTYNTSTITDPDNLAVGDVVVFANTTLGNVIAVDSDLGTFTCDPAVSFKGPQGATGSTGATGISITNVVVDASNHLICTLSDGNTIDAGAIQYNNYITLSATSGTLSDDDYNTALLYDSKIIYLSGSSKQVYSKWYEDNSTIIFHMIYPNVYQGTSVNSFTITKGTKGYLWATDQMPIFPSNMKTPAGTQADRILISDGNGGFNLYPNEASYNLATGITSGKVLTANGSGGCSWETPSGADVEGTAVKSTGETSGKVLTADGSGGASWQTAGGGKYMHYLFIGTLGTLHVYFNFVSTRSTPYSNTTQLYDDLLAIFNPSATYIRMNASGRYVSGSETYPVVEILFNNENMYRLACGYINLAGAFTTIQLYSYSIVQDKVVAL